MSETSIETGLITVRARYQECDPMGFVHHSVFPIWFEMGRTELLRLHGMNYRDLEADGFLLAVTRLEIRYRRPARYDEVFELETTLRRMTRVKLEHDYVLRRNGEDIATAQTTLACLGTDARPRMLPESILATGTPV